MKLLVGLMLFAVFLFLSAIHFYWGLGGKWGASAAIPTKENNEKIINPTMFECFVVAFGLLGFAVFILIESKLLLLSLPVWILNYGLWAISILFTLRAIGEFKYVGFFKKNKFTTFGQLDTKYYSPLCLAIGLLAIAMELIK